MSRIRRHAALTPEQREELLRSGALRLSSRERDLLKETVFAGASRLWEIEKAGRCPHCGKPLGGGDGA